jgi:hypothetical protein
VFRTYEAMLAVDAVVQSYRTIASTPHPETEGCRLLQPCAASARDLHSIQSIASFLDRELLNEADVAHLQSSTEIRSRPGLRKGRERSRAACERRSSRTRTSVKPNSGNSAANFPRWDCSGVTQGMTDLEHRRG